MTRRLKDPVLEKYLAGAMDDAARAEVDKTLAESPEDAQRLKELQADNDAFLIKHPPGAFAAKAVPDAVPFWKRPILWAPLVAGLAAVVVLLVKPPGVEPATTVKGSVALVLHRKTPTGSEEIGPDGVLHPGDTLRFEVRSGAAGAVAVFGRDATGVIRYAPQAENAAPSAGNTLLPGAISLDEARGPETFYAVWAPRSFDTETVRRALAAGNDVDSVVPGALMAERVVEKR